MSKYTPMIEQYLSIKAQAEDAILFFRLGDFYEMFFDDAIQAAQVLEITLTGREGGMEERIPMCGVPYHSAEAYMNRLVEKGFKVAICEQVEDPSEAKGVVRREIVRIVTPGTVMDGKMAPETKNNFLVCVSSSKDQYGLAACDLSTGELFVTATESTLEQLMDEINVYSPSELIGQPGVLGELRASMAGWLQGMLLTDWQRKDEKLLSSQFPQEQLRETSPVCAECVALLLSYLSETQKRALTHITRIENYERRQHMTMDPFTRRNLELTETVRERTKKGSLLWLLDRTVTSMGGRLLRRWIDKPLTNRADIEKRLEAVDCLYNRLIVREELRQQLKDVYDLQRLVGRISYGNANGRDLVALKLSLMQIPFIKQICAESGSSTLQELADTMDDCDDIRAWIEEAIADEPPVSVKEGGLIKQGYQAHLDQLREASANGKMWIAELERREKETTGIKSLKIGYNKVFGYYIEVTRSNLSSLPEHRYERKQTLANAERFVTPELKEKEALILEAEEKMVDIEYELFMQIRDKLAAEVKRLQLLAETVAAADVLQSFATVGATYRYRRPVITDGYDLVVKEGRHPVVEAILEGGSFIANDTDMARDDGRVLLITGPNMAGKSTYMRQVAMLSIMAQIGSFVPAEEATIPIVDRIFTRIGAADDLVGGQSTFMVEMMDIQTMTAKATERSLVIIDELGRGTSTSEGMAIAQAVIEFLHDRVGCKTLVSTHFHELAHLEETEPGLRNHCMAVKESDGDVTFLRKMIRGAASTSYGVYCARIAGLPDTIIDRAYELLSRFETASAVLQSADEAAAGRERTREETTQPPAAIPAAAASEVGGAEEAEAVPVREETFAPEMVKESPLVQLSLFGEGERPGKSAAKGKSKAELAAEKLSQRLQTADLINMTPLQAMNFLFELKQMAAAEAK
ncbi:DNA mismatch repair protein MutS [Paenibacillus ginsengarvi]|uniref:DNA mismatch repair protein MutS n=1 Tax=Paenibacillus ginsengarvi TaxID=400777 RepID=A0A3B0CQ93_9BACL|nr:DNA mismatch repair protein MutS [Paenibacillus ginsengarvi]RKN86591.1 DNA mismatch repair protein MutS [Paenibacillus ginsengarvi]